MDVRTSDFPVTFRRSVHSSSKSHLITQLGSIVNLKVCGSCDPIYIFLSFGKQKTKEPGNHPMGLIFFGVPETFSQKKLMEKIGKTNRISFGNLGLSFGPDSSQGKIPGNKQSAKVSKLDLCDHLLGGIHFEPRKKPSYFPLYWLVNRDPYNGLL